MTGVQTCALPICSIRASERRIYQQITDIFAECSVYDQKSETTRQFYAHVQDKFHFAITGHTAEIIYQNADADKPLMGMMTYKNAPDEIGRASCRERV